MERRAGRSSVTVVIVVWVAMCPCQWRSDSRKRRHRRQCGRHRLHAGRRLEGEERVVEGAGWGLVSSWCGRCYWSCQFALELWPLAKFFRLLSLPLAVNVRPSSDQPATRGTAQLGRTELGSCGPG